MASPLQVALLVPLEAWVAGGGTAVFWIPRRLERLLEHAETYSCAFRAAGSRGYYEKAYAGDRARDRYLQGRAVDRTGFRLEEDTFSVPQDWNSPESGASPRRVGATFSLPAYLL